MNVSANESSALAPSTAELVPPSAATAMSAIAASGTYEHPKLWEEATTIGAIHKYTYEGKNFFFAAKFDGNASDHNWFFPTGPYSNDYWEFKGAHAGTAADPKESNELTYVGAIHKRVINGGNLYFSSSLMVLQARYHIRQAPSAIFFGISKGPLPVPTLSPKT